MADVLIADDSSFVRSLLRAALGDAHEVVDEAETGVEVVELARAREPAVVILPTSLPIKDGLEAVEDLTELDVGIVVCSAERDEDTVETARSAGAHAFVARPFQREGLLEAVEVACEG